LAPSPTPTGLPARRASSLAPACPHGAASAAAPARGSRKARVRGRAGKARVRGCAGPRADRESDDTIGFAVHGVETR